MSRIPALMRAAVQLQSGLCPRVAPCHGSRHSQLAAAEEGTAGRAGQLDVSVKRQRPMDPLRTRGMGVLRGWQMGVRVSVLGDAYRECARTFGLCKHSSVESLCSLALG